jgi:sortase A
MWDWRRVLGGTGRVLIALGLLLLAFVAYQLWGTGIEYARSQDLLASEFDRAVASAPSTAPRTTVPTAAPTTVATTVAGQTTVRPPVTAAPATSTPAARAASIPPADGDPIARLEIPSIGLDAIVVEGVRVGDLKQGPGHYPGTPMPGQPGNAAIAGHRTTYGHPFGRIDELHPGDAVVVTTVAGQFTYRVSGSQIVRPSDYAVIGPTSDNRLTLTSCHPEYSASQRIIVRAALEGVPVPAPPTTPPVATSAAGGPAPPTTQPASSGGTAVATTGASPGARASAARAVGAQQFEQGWFSDGAAWVPLALWGLACTAVALAAWGLGRRTNRWVGAAVGLVPFLVVLYFFFENLNRLLPPNL